MNRSWMRVALAAATMAAAGAVQAADKTYQVTGPVLEVSDTSITVQKGKESWTLARGAETKMSGTPKVGDKVTVEYTMVAKSVELKGGKAGAAKNEPMRTEPAKKPAAAK